MASAWAWPYLQQTYLETAAAVLVAAERRGASELVATQGHVLRVDDLVATLAVEAAIHHLDLVAHLDLPGPPEPALDLARITLVGLLQSPPPKKWDASTFVRKTTGRAPLTEDERGMLGEAAARLPLIA